MISRIAGTLVDVADGTAEIECDGVWYRLFVPACDVQSLSVAVGDRVTFHTLQYLEAQGQGNTFLPRLIGFTSPEDRAFFELFTTVKGLGNRKALRALQLPFPRVAGAIAEGDLALLVSLPEIGKRTAQTIVAELDGKVDGFVELKPAPQVDDAETPPDERKTAIDDAVTLLVRLGEPRLFAQELVERAARADSELETADTLMAAAFRLKETG